MPLSWRPLFTVLRWPNNQVTLSRALIVAVLVLPMFVGMRWPPALASAVFMTGFWLFGLARATPETKFFFR